MTRCIAVDAMGGEGGPAVTVPATLHALERHPALSAILIGDREALWAASDRLEEFGPRLSIEHSSQVVLDSDKPASVLRSGQNTSLYRSVELHCHGIVSAVVSAGNTGSMLLLGRHLLKTIDGVELPAIVATLPSHGSSTLLLDVGANLACTPTQLEQFAIMGAELARVQFAANARVALLNVGAEDHKGTRGVREAAILLEQHSDLDYVGFVEANHALAGKAEVIVCDGFVGNVMIKASAGAANTLRAQLQAGLTEVFAGADSDKAAALAAKLSALNPQRFNGATLLGLKGNVVKSHGNADVLGFGCAIDLAYTEQRDDVPERIRRAIAR